MAARPVRIVILLAATTLVAGAAGATGVAWHRAEAARAAAVTASQTSHPPSAVAAQSSTGDSSCCILPKRFAQGPTTHSAGSPASQPVASAGAPAGMKWVPGGEFTMGGDDADARPDERPIHRVRLDGFWIDTTLVTNAQFRAFVQATGYVTTAEKKPDWEELKKQLPPGTPPPPAEKMVPASLVFRPTPGPVPLDDASQWWEWVPGSDWRHPEGPGSNIEGKDNYPVVQVSWDDAVAYAKWLGKRLPTEAEFEYAGRGGLDHKKYAWGDQDPSDNDEHPHCNIWQGHFPDRNTARDGYERSSPVTAFPPNGYGLYDMAGNVWEWCADWYRPDSYATDAAKGVVTNPTGPSDSLDPTEPYTPKRVTRGGSFLCNANYCSSYRAAARMKTSPDSGTDHTGFRCVVSGRPTDNGPR